MNPKGARQGASHPDHRRHFRSVLTFDLHGSDEPRAVEMCAEALERLGLTAVFFVPTTLTTNSQMGPALRSLAACGHEMGTHGHAHDWSEMDALRNGPRSSLRFLEQSTQRFSEYFGQAPRSFRAPCWCRLCDAAIDELERLGYRVDSSATPQRLGLLSSFPFENPYLFSPRSPHFLRRTLLEVPTTSFLIPLGAPTIETFPRLVLPFARALMLEASLWRSRILVAQLHVGAHDPKRREAAHSARTWRDLVPATPGGIRARHWLRTRDEATIAQIANGIISELSLGRVMTLQEIYGAVGSSENNS